MPRATSPAASPATTSPAASRATPTSESNASPTADDPDATPWVVRATAAIAWLVATLALVGVAAEAGNPAQGLADVVFWVTLASGAAYLGMALCRRTRVAWLACLRIALGCGVANTVVLAVLVGCLLAGVESAAIERFAPAVGWESIAALVALAGVPWLLFFGLRGPSVRAWIAAAT